MASRAEAEALYVVQGGPRCGPIAEHSPRGYVYHSELVLLDAAAHSKQGSIMVEVDLIDERGEVGDGAAWRGVTALTASMRVVHIHDTTLRSGSEHLAVGGDGERGVVERSLVREPFHTPTCAQVPLVDFTVTCSFGEMSNNHIARILLKLRTTRGEEILSVVAKVDGAHGSAHLYATNVLLRHTRQQKDLSVPSMEGDPLATP